MDIKWGTVDKVYTILIGILVWTLFFTFLHYGHHCARHAEEREQKCRERFEKGVNEALYYTKW